MLGDTYKLVTEADMMILEKRGRCPGYKQALKTPGISDARKRFIRKLIWQEKLIYFNTKKKLKGKRAM